MLILRGLLGEFSLFFCFLFLVSIFCKKTKDFKKQKNKNSLFLLTTIHVFDTIADSFNSMPNDNWEKSLRYFFNPSTFREGLNNGCTFGLSPYTLWLPTKTKNFCFLVFINFLFFAKYLEAKNKKLKFDQIIALFSIFLNIYRKILKFCF